VTEFLVEFEVEVPAGTPPEEVDRRERAESDAAAKLAEDGPVGLYRADSAAELDGLLGALPIADWLRVTVTPLEAHPNDPAEASR
jgi:muconolactone D-isomerase